MSYCVPVSSTVDPRQSCVCNHCWVCGCVFSANQSLGKPCQKDVGSSLWHSIPQYCILVHTCTCTYVHLHVCTFENCVYGVSRIPDVLCLDVGMQASDHTYSIALQRRPCPEESATFLSRITWWWLNGYAMIQYIHVCTLPI